MRIRKRGLLSGARQKCDARPGEEAEPVLSAMHNFEILADMGVPSDIFDEPGEPVRVQKCPLVSSLIRRFKTLIDKDAMALKVFLVIFLFIFVKYTC